MDKLFGILLVGLIIFAIGSIILVTLMVPFWNTMAFCDWYFQVAAQHSFLNTISAWKPEFAWALSGFILYSVGYFVLMEAHRLRRASFESLCYLLFAGTLIIPFILLFIPTQPLKNSNLLAASGEHTGSLIGWSWTYPPCDPPDSCGAGGSKPVYTIMLKDSNTGSTTSSEFYYGLNVTRDGQPVKQFSTCDQQPNAYLQQCFQNTLKEHLKIGEAVTVYVTCGRDHGCYTKQIDLKTGLTAQQKGRGATVVTNAWPEARPKEPTKPDQPQGRPDTPRNPPRAVKPSDELDMYAPPKKY